MRRSRLGEIQERFWVRANVAEDGKCWEWQGTMHGSGYGVIQGKLFGERVGKLLAHRAAWLIANGGKFPDGAPPGAHGWVVMHTCDNRRCVNPSHLKLGSQADNVADMDAKSRDNRHGILPRSGGNHPRATLSAEQVAAIMFGGKSDQEFASEFGVHHSTVKRVRRGETYKSDSAGGKRHNERFSASGEANPYARLTYEQVRLIRTSPKSTYELAAELGVTQVCVASARRGATYKNVDVPCPPSRVGRMRKAA